MALPFVLLTWFPGWRKVLPKPGVWMERLKQFLAFPLYATVAWLVWVLGAQVDNDAVVRLLVTLVVAGLRAVGVARVSRRRRARLLVCGARSGSWRRRIVAWPLFSGQVAARRALARAGVEDNERPRIPGSRSRRPRSPSSPPPTRSCSSISPRPGASPAR